ncbi:hypothetical protein HDU85_007340 [Gaertneriomyces sp. JEL0708]|nr:hypothetical protein HDU85_007340 [Gaertneriomyces sp. JEL0708]
MGPVPKFPDPLGSTTLPRLTSGVAQNDWIFNDYHFLETPSVRYKADPYSMDKEVWFRHHACDFVERIGGYGEPHRKYFPYKGMRLPRTIISFAKVMLHRFYMRNAFQECPYREVGAALLFLACKMGEGHHMHSLETVVNVAAQAAKKDASITREDCDVWRKRILYWEAEIVTALEFDLIIELPYQVAATILKQYNASEELYELAMQYINVAMNTTLPIREKTTLIAQAAIYVASVVSNEELHRVNSGGKTVKFLEEESSDRRLIISLAYEITSAKDQAKVRKLVTKKLTLLEKRRRQSGANSLVAKTAQAPIVEQVQAPVTPVPTSPSKTPHAVKTTPSHRSPCLTPK